MSRNPQPATHNSSISRNPQLTTYNPILLLVFLSSCSVLRNKDLLKTDSLERREVVTTEKTSAISRLIQQHVLLLTDSSGTHFTTQIIPEGEFSLAPDGAFRGRASLIQMEGSRKTYSALKDSGSVSRNSVLNNETEANMKTLRQSNSVAKKKNVKSNGPGSFWYWITAVLLAGAGFWVYRKWGKRK